MAAITRECFATAFDCQSSSTPDEIVICADARLGRLDELIVAAFKQASAIQGHKVKARARELLAVRRACETDAVCILDVQIETIRAFEGMGVVTILPPWVNDHRRYLVDLGHNNTATGGKVSYGSRAGMHVSVVTKSGIDTTAAVIRTFHTRADAVDFCREYVLKVTEDCIQKEMAGVKALRRVIVANCMAGIFTDFHGSRFRIARRSASNRASLLTTEFRIENMTTHEVADGSSASGYWTNLEIFTSLCPRFVKSDVPGR
jgi:uncharacterized protein